jgi:ATP-grasp enzyme of GAK system
MKILISRKKSSHSEEFPMKLGVVGIPGKWSTEALADELEKLTSYRHVVDMRNVRYDSDSATVFHGDLDLATLDGLVIKKVGLVYSPHMLDRLDLLTLLKGKGLKIFSDPVRIGQVLNRASCTIRLGAGGIPMPDTLITENLEEARQGIKKFGKAVLKPLYTSKARGMVLIEDDDNADDTLNEFREDGNTVIYMQEFVKLPGKDLGLVFLGGEYIDTYARVSGGAWNTTTHSGGKYEAYKPDAEIIDLAYKAQALFKLDFTSVDVVETDDGPMVFEVSAFGGFRGLKEALNINAAELYASYVYKAMQG